MRADIAGSGRGLLAGRSGSIGVRVALRLLAVIAVLVTLLRAPGVAAQEVNDPFEPVNRAIFSFNRVADGLVLEPAAELYGYVPQPARTKVRNVLRNIRSPIVFANDLLQGERERAGITLARFMINSTFGIAGIFDAAQTFGYPPRHNEDFGQTLAVWGVGNGPYLMLPLLGPSTVRDASGLTVDIFLFDVFGYVTTDDLQLGRRAAVIVDGRQQIDDQYDDLEENSLDFYSALRTVYYQRRASEIRNGRAPERDDSYEDIFDESFDDSELDNP